MKESVGRGAPYVRTTRNWLNTSWICLRLIIWRGESEAGLGLGPGAQAVSVRAEARTGLTGTICLESRTSANGLSAWRRHSPWRTGAPSHWFPSQVFSELQTPVSK